MTSGLLFMSTLATAKNRFTSYSFNRSTIPFPEQKSEKINPPVIQGHSENTKDLFKPIKELTLEDEAQKYMDSYRKAERVVVINFYTGGGPYRKGVMDSIYRGFNPLNP